MLLIAAAVIAASPPHEPPLAGAGASVQATATIRVIAGVRVNFGGGRQDADIPRPRLASIHAADAKRQFAKLIEFE